MPTINCETGEITFDPAPIASFAELKSLKWERAKAIRDALETGGAATPAGRVQTDGASVVKINGMVTAAIAAQVAGAPFAMGFALEDNSVAVLDGAGAIALGLAVAGHISRVYQHSFALRAAIAAAPTIAALDAIDIEEGWPA